jgi:hypothetical protein
MRFFVTPVDLRDPARPVLATKVNVPGPLVSVRAATQSWYTLVPVVDPKTNDLLPKVAVAALFRPDGQSRAYLEGQRLLDGSLAGFAIDGTTLWTALDNRLVAFDLAQPKTLPELSRTEIPGIKPGPRGDAHDQPGPPIYIPDLPGRPYEPTLSLVGVFGGRALLGAGHNELRVVDVRDPARPVLGATVASGRGLVRPTLGTDGRRLYFALAEAGVVVVD